MEKQLITFNTRGDADAFKERMKKIAPAAFVQVCFMRSRYRATVQNATEEQVRMAMNKETTKKKNL